MLHSFKSNFFYRLQLYIKHLRCILPRLITTMQVNLSGEKNVGDKNVKVSVPVVFFMEDNTHFAYIPSFDITGYGNNNQEALDSVTVVLDEFLRYTINKNTFVLELKRLGWKVRSRKKPMIAPQMSELINTSEQLREIVNNKHYTTSDFQVNVPAFA